MTCGIHEPGTLPCRYCERAAVANDAALADVVQRRDGNPPSMRRLTPADVRRVLELAAQGASQCAIGRDIGFSPAAVKRVLVEHSAICQTSK